MRASRFYALAGRDSADEAQRSQHWIDAGNLYARALDEFEKGPTEENSMADIRRAILDRDQKCVHEDQLAEMPTDAQVIWKKNRECANRILEHYRSVVRLFLRERMSFQAVASLWEKRFCLVSRLRPFFAVQPAEH